MSAVWNNLLHWHKTFRRFKLLHYCFHVFKTVGAWRWYVSDLAVIISNWTTKQCTFHFKYIFVFELVNIKACDGKINNSYCYNRWPFKGHKLIAFIANVNIIKIEVLSCHNHVARKQLPIWENRRVMHQLELGITSWTRQL